MRSTEQVSVTDPGLLMTCCTAAQTRSVPNVALSSLLDAAIERFLGCLGKLTPSRRRRGSCGGGAEVRSWCCPGFGGGGGGGWRRAHQRRKDAVEHAQDQHNGGEQVLKAQVAAGQPEGAVHDLQPRPYVDGAREDQRQVLHQRREGVDEEDDQQQRPVQDAGEAPGLPQGPHLLAAGDRDVCRVAGQEAGDHHPNPVQTDVARQGLAFRLVKALIDNLPEMEMGWGWRPSSCVQLCWGWGGGVEVGGGGGGGGTAL